LPAEAVFDVLFQLAAESLVVTGPIGDEAARYRPLETLRAYAGERLAAGSDSDR
jgi:predicted ATPase